MHINRFFGLLAVGILFFISGVNGQINPVQDYPDLFYAVQENAIFSDSKKFPDCKPLIGVDTLNAFYLKQVERGRLDLKAFVVEYFDTLTMVPGVYVTKKNQDAASHIYFLWNVLIREPEEQSNSSRIALKHSYVVPGGRFNEVYYWDSYFTMLGLQANGKTDLIRSMIDNFADLIERYGHIPNGNRTYYLSRSQPPFFASMVELLVESTGDSSCFVSYLPYLEKEYSYWMQGKESLNGSQASQNVVEVSEGVFLNRYWDALNVPRPEAYKEDVEIFRKCNGDSSVFRELRAAAESGWDFSSRWFRDEKKLETIHTTEIVPVDLNCLLYNMEKILSIAHAQTGNREKEETYVKLSALRREAINRYCWNKDKGYYFDYDWKKGCQTNVYSAAGIFPLYFNVASENQASRATEFFSANLMEDLGVVCTKNKTGQQWDYPNGWAPLQWIAYKGLLNYNGDSVAHHLASVWLNMNEEVFRETGKMLEKYNVTEPTPGGGGEYPLQDGFGWTNGVYLKLSELEKERK